MVQWWAKQPFVRNRNKTINITELQLNLQKYDNVCYCGFNEISIKRKKTVLQEKFDPTMNFDLMINLDVF